MATDLPPRVERALKLLGFATLDDARARLRRLGGRFVTMSGAAGSELEPRSGFSWGDADVSHRVTMTEKDFALFGLFASIGLEALDKRAPGEPPLLLPELPQPPDIVLEP